MYVTYLPVTCTYCIIRNSLQKEKHCQMITMNCQLVNVTYFLLVQHFNLKPTSY